MKHMCCLQQQEWYHYGKNSKLNELKNKQNLQ